MLAGVVLIVSFIVTMSKPILDCFKKYCALPDSRGPLSNVILPSTIVATNTEVLKLLESPNHSSLARESEKREAYSKFTSEFKATTAKWAIENGNSRAARKFNTPDKVISESTNHS